MQTLDELLREHEAELEAKAQIEKAQEEAAWAALTDAEKAAQIAAQEAKYQAELERQERIAREMEAKYGPDDAQEELFEV